MITVILYGHLAEKYGKRHKLDIKTPAEAIRAFCANYKTFKDDLIQDGQAMYRVLAGKEERADAEGLHIGTAKTIKIVPVVAGSGGLGKVLAGVALIGLSYWLPGVSSFGTQLLWGTTTVSSFLGAVGTSLALGGLSQMLSPAPKVSGSREATTAPGRPSFYFNGAINTTGQGNPVPVLYGRLRVGSQVISAGLDTVQI